MNLQSSKKLIENSILKNNPKTFKTKLYFNYFNTKLGLMLGIFDDNYLYFLGFIDSKNLIEEIKRLTKKLSASLILGTSKISKDLDKKLKLYFSNKLKIFDIPFKLTGTNFQIKVWNQLTKIEYGGILSYKEIARLLKMPKACRAIGNANGSNKICLIIPCHRVIRENGSLGGYSAGDNKKSFLINLEKNLLSK